MKGVTWGRGGGGNRGGCKYGRGGCKGGGGGGWEWGREKGAWKGNRKEQGRKKKGGEVEGANTVVRAGRY